MIKVKLLRKIELPSCCYRDNNGNIIFPDSMKDFLKLLECNGYVNIVESSSTKEFKDDIKTRRKDFVK